MEERIEDKINKLNFEQQKIYKEELIGICEFRDNCIFYGAKDYINLPQSDINIIKINLYQEMFELYGKKRL